MQNIYTTGFRVKRLHNLTLRVRLFNQLTRKPWENIPYYALCLFER